MSAQCLSSRLVHPSVSSQVPPSLRGVCRPGMELSRLRRGIAGGRLGVSAEPRRLRSSHARGRAVRVAAATGDAKAALLAEVDGKQSRTALAELVLDLEAENPTPEPARSPLLAGQWRFAYSGGVAPGPVPSPTRPIALAMYAGGFTPGTLGLSVRCAPSPQGVV